MAESTKKTSKTKTEPKVEIFGESVVHKDRFQDTNFEFHHHHRGGLTWGLILILLGLMLLLSNFGVLPPIVWTQVFHLWPILIILIGIDTILGHSEIAEIISSLIGLFLFATVIGVVFLNVNPILLNGLPVGILNYLHSISSYLQLK